MSDLMDLTCSLLRPSSSSSLPDSDDRMNRHFAREWTQQGGMNQKQTGFILGSLAPASLVSSAAVREPSASGGGGAAGLPILDVCPDCLANQFWSQRGAGLAISSAGMLIKHPAKAPKTENAASC
eukprot:scaffold255099_cov44-Prasinocladus_malaysianus.AAC.1